MSSPLLLHGSSLWRELERLARQTSGPRKVAVAYVGPHSVDTLHLESGDTLHCALSIRNAKAGIVCPGELLKLRKRKVHIFAHEHMHAKIYLLGNTAIVGSPNVSRSSLALDEAALQTRDRTTVDAIRGWFHEREDQEVSDGFLEKCDAVYRPPKWNPFFHNEVDRSATPRQRGSRSPLRAGQRKRTSERWWLLWNAGPVVFNEEQERYASESEERAKARLKKRRWNDLDQVIWTSQKVAKEIRVGDKVVCTVPSSGGQAVTPWGTCFGIRRWTAPNGKLRVIITCEFRQPEVQLAYRKFVKRAQASGLPIKPRGGSLHYDNPVDIRVLRRLTSSSSLGRK